jgi:AcrR family transcriptional regulator
MTEADKRQAILNATLDLIAEHGFHGTSVSMIVKASKVSTGIVYHYFESKDEIIAALYWELKGAFGKYLLQDVKVEDEWQERLKQIWFNAYRYFIHHPKEIRFLEQYDNSPYHKEQLDEVLRPLSAMIAEDIAQGHIKNLPSAALEALTIGVAFKLAKAHCSGRRIDDERVLDAVADACCTAIAL